MASLDSVAPDTQPGLHVLVVNDDRDTADSLAVLLGLWGHRARVPAPNTVGMRSPSG